MKSYLRLGYRGFRVTAGVISLGIALFYGGMAQAAPQYDISCDDCHRMPPLDSTSGTREPATGAFKGNHQTHAGATASSCGKCHGNGVVTYPTGHRDKTIQVQGNINNSPATGAYSRVFFNQTSVPPTPLGTCSNVNCHFEFLSDAWGVPPASTYTALGASGTTCGKCHGAPPGDGSHPAASGSGKKHGDYYGTGTGSCVKCHPDHTAEGNPFAHATSAGNRGLILQFAAPNSGGAYSKSANLSYPNYLPSQTSEANRNGTCSSLYCHSDGAGGAPNTVPAWGGALPADCTGCHDGNAASATIISSGKHGQHVNNAGFLGDNYECARCHSATVTASNDQAVTALASHTDGTKTVAFNNGGTYGAGTCSATLCHAAGKAAAPQPAAPAWSGAALDCKGCHGAGGNYGEPSYGNAGAALDLANSHNAKHIAGAVSCANCHNSATADGVSIKPGAPHTDGAISVSFGAAYDLGGAAYNGTIGTKSCSATYCHSNGNGGAPLQTAKWGDSMPANCTGCHGNDATVSAGKSMATGAHRAHMNNYTTLGSGNSFKCAECHAKTVALASNQAITTPASHLNTLKDYSGARAGNNYVAATKVCSNVYCHSSGQQPAVVYRNMTGSKAWGGTAKSGCNGCHGYGAGAFTPVAGEPNYVNGGIASGAENSHQAHVGHLGVTTTRGCVKCHRTTVDAGVANKLRDYSSAHLNRTVNISFQVLGNYTGHFNESDKSCTNTYCHAGTPAQWGGAPKNCYDCHKADATLGGNHYIHWQSTGVFPPAYVMTPGNTGDAANYRWACSACHQGEDANGPPAEGCGSAAEVFFGYSSANRKGTYTFGSNKTMDGTLMQSDGTCANTYCHSDGIGGGPISGAFNWYSNPGTIGCAGCHGGNAGSASPMASGKHTVHMNNTAVLGVNFACAACHGNVVGTDSSVSDKRKHVDKFKNYSGQMAYKSFYTGATANCSASYCHSNGKGSAGNAVTWSQGGSWATKCNQCHGTGNPVGAPDYASGSAGSATANNHLKHALSSAGNYGISCGECHSPTTKNGTDIRTGVAPTYHINLAVNDVFYNLSGANKDGSYMTGSKTCDSIYCHSDGTAAVAPFTVISTARWGATLSCKGCHGYTAASGKTINSYRHSNHINNATVTGRNIGCQDCHYATTANGTTISTIADHTNQSVNIKFDNSVNLNSDLPTYNSGATTGAGGYAKAVGNAAANNGCANVYCHSTGTVNGATPTFKPMTWSGSWPGSKCVNCHGDGSGRTHNSPDVTNNPGGGNGNNHVRHVEAKGLSCDYCHVDTTTDSTAYPALPTAIINGGSHLNRIDDVNFKSYGAMTGAWNGTVGTKRCSSTYCHSSGEATPAAPLKTAKWGDRLDCRGCHGGDAAHANPINTSKHAAHINNTATLGAGNNYTCAECHAKTIATFANNTTVGSQASHVNAFRDYSGANASNTGYAGGSCTTHCHSTGQATPVFRSMTGSKAWGGTASLGCNGCHGYGPGTFSSAYGAPNYVSGVAGSATANSHKKHVYDAGMTSTTGCANCHRITVDAGVANGLRGYSSAHLNKVRNISFASLGNYTGHYAAGAKSCDNTYCHAGNSATWGGAALACNSCHKADSTLPGRHGTHWAQPAVYPASYTSYSGNVSSAAQYRFQCASCHKANHANGPVQPSGNAAEIFFNVTTAGRAGSYAYGGATAMDGTLKWSNGTCATTYCHSDGNGGNPTNGAFNWNSGTGVLDCTGCHGGTVASGTTIASYKHRNHIDPSLNTSLGTGNGIGCVACHAKTVTNDTTLGSKLKHVNKFKDYSGVMAGGSARYNTTIAKSCNNIYCHSDGNQGAVVFVSMTGSKTWIGAATVGCNSCHGRSNPNTGAPDYANGYPGNANTYNSHSKHITQFIAQGAANNTTICARCHAKTADASVANKYRNYSTLHLNGTANVSMQAAYGGTYGSNVCSSVFCHSNGKGLYRNPTWGQTSDCSFCHPMNALSGAHRFHVYTSVTNNTPSFYDNYTANRSNTGSATGRYNFGCSVCHPTGNTAHMTGAVLIDLKPVAAGGTLKSKNSASITLGAVVAGAANSGTFGTPGANIKCFGVYCHSNGGSAAGAVAFQAYTSPEWYTSAGKPSDPCSMCHGNWPNSPRAGDNKVMAGSPTHYNSDWLGTGQAGSHTMGIHARNIADSSSFTALLIPGSSGNVSHGVAGQATTISCNICHNATVTTSANNGSAQCAGCHTQPATQAAAAIADKSKHLNGSVNVVFQTATVISKAQLRDASFSLNSSSTLWHRNGGYKAGAGSFDTAKRNLNLANPYASATGCSNVICHFNQNVKWNNPAPAVTCNSCHLSAQM